MPARATPRPPGTCRASSVDHGRRSLHAVWQNAPMSLRTQPSQTAGSGVGGVGGAHAAGESGNTHATQAAQASSHPAANTRAATTASQSAPLPAYAVLWMIGLCAIYGMGQIAIKI